ncbi:MAG: CoA pyrophosphatase [Gammaproteobacteria bacterium]|nr:CoA pyrophosphatase [Gammaproteobacteria bacterium]MDP2142363.1 CoA pyrophosphatase [Gammaproteobacteria bacterium]MDP2348604.1 CoA pyrophosphatase [Gammaproteobacteria bacterium]
MPIPATPHNEPILQKLLRYFEQQSLPRKAILHPDRDINRLINSAELPAANFRNAAVLIPIRDVNVILTLRTEHLSSHPGQVSFPGGTTDACDASPVATALRESEEEIGLCAESVQIIGQLGNLLMPSGYCVTPVVGLLAADTLLIPSPREVAHIFTVPVSIALNTASYQRTRVMLQDSEREILEFHHEGYRIWGATATILYHLALELETADNST